MFLYALIDLLTIHVTCSVAIIIFFMSLFFADKTKRSLTAVDGSGSIDRSHSHAPHDSVSDSSELLGVAALEGDALGSSAENQLAANHISAKAKQKTSHSKTAKSRPTCVVCNKTFHTRYKLNEHHAVVHLDKRLFSCNVCQKPFGRADHLIRHVRNRVCFQRQQMPESADTSSRRGK